MRLFRWLFRLIFGFIILTVISIGVPIALLYKSVTPPSTDDFASFNFNTLIAEQIDHLIDENNDDKEIGLYIEESLLNAEIHRMLLDAFKDNLTNEEGYIATYEDIALIQGAWVTFKDNAFQFNVGVHLKYGGITFKTRLLVEIKVIEISTSKITLKIDKIKLGNLPLQWALTLLPKVAGQFGEFDIDEMISEAIGDIGTYNSAKRELSVDVAKLLQDSTGDNALIANLITLVEENELLKIGLGKRNEKRVFFVTIDLNKIKSDKIPYVLLESDRIKDEDEFNSFLQSKILAGIVSEKISFGNKDLSKIIDYILMESNQLQSNAILEQEVYQDYEVKILVPYFDITNKATLNIPILLGKGLNHFKSNISIDIDFNKVDDDLVLEFSNVTIGTLELPDAMLEELLSEVASDAMELDGMSFVINDFFVPFNEQNITVKEDGVNIANDKLNLEFDLLGFDVEDMLSDIKDVLDDDDLEEILDDVLDMLDSGNIDEEQLMDLLDDFMEGLEDLDEAKVEAIMNIMEDYLANIPIP